MTRHPAYSSTRAHARSHISAASTLTLPLTPPPTSRARVWGDNRDVASQSVIRHAGSCLRPYDRREGLTTAEAAVLAGRTERRLRGWCVEHGIGRRIGGGPWVVSKVALAMLLDGNAVALKAYLGGDRHSEMVAAYYVAAGIEDLLRRWRSYDQIGNRVV